MVRNFILLLLACTLLLATGARSADACGAWGISDTQRGQNVIFYARTVKVSKPGSRPRTAIKIFGKKPATFSAIRGDWQRGKQPIMRIESSQVFLYGEKVGEFAAGDVFRLKDTEYRIAIKFDQEEYCSGRSSSDEPFSVSVVENTQEVARGNAMSFLDGCSGEVAVTEGNRCRPEILGTILGDIRYRVGLYLVWRDLVDGTQLSKSRPASPRPAVDDSARPR